MKYTIGSVVYDTEQATLVASRVSTHDPWSYELYRTKDGEFFSVAEWDGCCVTPPGLCDDSFATLVPPSEVQGWLTQDSKVQMEWIAPGESFDAHIYEPDLLPHA